RQIHRSEPPSLGRPNGQLDERRRFTCGCLRQQRSQSARCRALGGPSFSSDQDAADRWIDRDQDERELQILLTHYGGKWKIGSHGEISAASSMVDSLDRSVVRNRSSVSGLGAQSRRCSASSRRSTIAFNAHGLSRCRNRCASPLAKLSAMPSNIQSVTIPEVAKNPNRASTVAAISRPPR